MAQTSGGLVFYKLATLSSKELVEVFSVLRHVPIAGGGNNKDANLEGVFLCQIKGYLGSFLLLVLVQDQPFDDIFGVVLLLQRVE